MSWVAWAMVLHSPCDSRNLPIVVNEQISARNLLRLNGVFMSEVTALSPGLSPQKQQLLLAFHQTCWDEMTWRRNAGYRTVILGFGYFAMLLTIVTFNHNIDV